jgi:hypothetical protein
MKWLILLGGTDMSAMKTQSSKTIIVGIFTMLSCLLAVGVEDALSIAPPVAAALVRLGNFALSLVTALGLGQPASEAAAESMLGGIGIAPRNGWIADYPVTPDIIGELRDSLVYASQARTISMGVNAALNALAEVEQSASMALTPAPAGPPTNYLTAGTPEGAEQGVPAYPDAAAVRQYYSQQGPPIITYYAPPADFYYLYTWVPYPFWCNNFWFGGYFILNDFHRFFRDRDYLGEHNHFVSNHFNDVNAHHVFRIDPITRMHGRTFEGIGAPHGSNFIHTGVKESPARIFNNTRMVASRSGTNFSSSHSMSTGTFSKVSNPFPQSRVYSQPAGGGQRFIPSKRTDRSAKTFSASRGGGHAGGSSRVSSHGPSHSLSHGGSKDSKRK